MNQSYSEFLFYLVTIGLYSVLMLFFGKWLVFYEFSIEDQDDQEDQEKRNAPIERWMHSSDGSRLVPRIERIHIIPIEDSVQDFDSSDQKQIYLHCATMECWCTPKFAACDDSDRHLEGVIVLHNAITQAENGWVHIGENTGAV